MTTLLAFVFVVAMFGLVAVGLAELARIRRLMVDTNRLAYSLAE